MRLPSAGQGKLVERAAALISVQGEGGAEAVPRLGRKQPWTRQPEFGVRMVTRRSPVGQRRPLTISPDHLFHGDLTRAAKWTIIKTSIVWKCAQIQGDKNKLEKLIWQQRHWPASRERSSPRSWR